MYRMIVEKSAMRTTSHYAIQDASSVGLNKPKQNQSQSRQNIAISNWGCIVFVTDPSQS